MLYGQGMVIKKRSLSNNSTMDASSSVDNKSSKDVLPLHESFGRSSSSSPPQKQQQQQSDKQRASSSSPQFWRRFKRHYSGEELPTWSSTTRSNPQSPGDTVDSVNANIRTNSNNLHSHHHHHHHSGSSTTSNSASQQIKQKQWAWTILFLLLAGGAYVSISSRNRLRQSLIEVEELLENSEQLTSKLTSAEKGIRMLQREVSAHDAMQQHRSAQQAEAEDWRNNGNSYTNQALEEMNKLSETLQVSTQKAQYLKQRVQMLSEEETLLKYGPGPFRVEIELAFPDQQVNVNGPTKFVIELAPLDLMPHSVHFFLEMASMGLLDGCSFILNALHVLKAAPLPYDGSSAASKARAFARMGLESVAFKEYSEQFPHKQYTVGFAADGSPSFYINTEDNEEIHMGDPCFGKIVEGFDTVKRLESSPTRNGIWFEQRIGIKKATVLK